MTQTLKLPAVSVGEPASLEVKGANETDPLKLSAPTTNLISYVDDLVFYEDEIVEYH